MDIKLKVGESGWFRTRCNALALVFNTGVGLYPLIGSRKGVDYIADCWTSEGVSIMAMFKDHDLVEYLPDCTGWDWEPKSKLQEMAEKIRRISIGIELRNPCEGWRDSLQEIATELESMEVAK